MLLNAYRRLLFALGPYRWFSAFVYRVLQPIERLLYRATGGRVSAAHAGRHVALPELMLITRGRKTGRERRAPVLYLEDGVRLFVVGSNFGRERHPAWTANLLADPAAEVIVRGERNRMRALRAGQDDLVRMWPRMLEV